jgi:hypothetical protein
MQLGVLYHNKANFPLEVAVKMGRNLFDSVPHTQGYPPVEIHFHPDQKPPVAVIDGLAVAASKLVPLDHIRICTAAAGPGPTEPDELELERAFFMRQVSQVIAAVQDL